MPPPPPGAGVAIIIIPGAEPGPVPGLTDPGRETACGHTPPPSGSRKEVFVLERPPAEGRRATLVATLTTLPEGSAVPLVSDLEGIDWLEVRADLVGDLDAGRLARIFPGKLLYTLRSKAEGGASESSPERRRKRLVEGGGRAALRGPG